MGRNGDGGMCEAAAQIKATHSAPHSLVAQQDSVEEPLFGVVVAAALASRVPAGPAASGFVPAAASRARHPHC